MASAFCYIRRERASVWEPPPPPACKHAPRSCPVAVACRILSPRRCACPRLCMLALWATPLEKTIFNRFLCANPPAGRLLCASVFAYLSAMIIAFLSVLLNFTVRLPEAKPPRCGRIPASRFDRGACLHAGGGGGSHFTALSPKRIADATHLKKPPRFSWWLISFYR